MARARNIKPKFFQNDELGELPPLARLLFIGMWTIADFRGCLEFRPKRIKTQLLPYDECDIEALAMALDKSGFISIYTVQGQRYAKIIKFERHQTPHKNERDAGSDIPDISEKDSEINELREDGKNPDKNGTTRAESLFPLPDSLNLPTDSPLGASAPGTVLEKRAEVLEAIEQTLSFELTDPTPVPKREKPADEDFERAWALYPKRDGGNPKKDALSAWCARLREGVPAEDMIAGVQRYAAHMQAKGKIGTEYVMQAVRFFGPSKQYAEPWPVRVSDAGSAGDKFHVAHLDHSSSRAAMEASMRQHGIVVPEGDDEIKF